MAQHSTNSEASDQWGPSATSLSNSEVTDIPGELVSILHGILRLTLT